MSLLFLSALTACTDLASRAVYLTGPEAFVWEDSEFTIQGKRKMLGFTSLSEGEFSLWVRGFPPSTELAVGEAKAQTDESGYASVDTQVGPMYGRLVVSDDWNTSELEGLTFSVTPPGGQAIQVPLPAVTVYFPGETLRESIVKGPVLYEGETEGDAAITSAYLYNGYDDMVFGNAKTFADFDGVAVITRTTLKEVVCDGYEDEQGNPATSVILEVQDARVDLYGRRSGKIVATQTFPPGEESCPESVFSFSEGQQKRSTSIPKEEVSAWVQAQLSLE
ncbi:MAG: hypothetical protein ACI9VR_000313 [Cognaticolwellia sp.]|jgi:hypothetical protein